jgi:SAM-dependent methyltransferase
MDPQTSAFYDRHALVVPTEEAARSAMSAHFARAFAAGARVLDVGAGSGRDLAVLLEQGLDAWGVEPNAALRGVALRRHPALAPRLVEGALPDIGTPFGGRFDGIVCAAVLMHLSPDELPAALQALARLLADNGRLLVSVPALPPRQLRDRRDRDGRLFTNHAPETLRALLSDLGLRQIGRWDSIAGTGRTATRWATCLFGRA